MFKELRCMKFSLLYEVDYLCKIVLLDKDIFIIFEKMFLKNKVIVY